MCKDSVDGQFVIFNKPPVILYNYYVYEKEDDLCITENIYPESCAHDRGAACF